MSEKRRKIPVESLKPGVIFDQPVYIDSSNVLVDADVAITEVDIKKLMTWGIDVIETSGKEIDTTSVADQQSLNQRQIVNQYKDLLRKRKDLLNVHTRAQAVVKEAYGCIRLDRTFEIDKIQKSVVEIIELLRKNQHVFLFLYGLAENDNYLISHSVNVTFYAIILGMALGYDESKLIELGTGAMLIDAGMVKIPVYIMNKQSKLTDQEFNTVKTHPLLGYKALKQLAFVSDNIANVSLQHHEQFDGQGYPRGLKGNEISEFANIVSIADCYEAQISNRSYKKKVYFHHAMKNLMASGVSKFDPRLLSAFLPSLSLYPIGSIVELNNKTIGIVIGSSPDKPLRPIVRLIFDENRNEIKELVLLNLIEKTNIFIVKALEEDQLNINIFDVL